MAGKYESRGSTLLVHSAPRRPPINGLSSAELLRVEQIALHDRVHQVANAVSFFSCRLDNPVQGCAVGEADGRTGGVNHELLREIAGQRRLTIEEQLLEFTDVAETASVRQFA